MGKFFFSLLPLLYKLTKPKQVALQAFFVDFSHEFLCALLKLGDQCKAIQCKILFELVDGEIFRALQLKNLIVTPNY